MDNSIFNILIVDDVPKNIQIIGNHLREQGYNLEFATNGKMALDWTKKKQFDLILLDIMMPEMNGYEVCRKLKSDKNYKFTPIIFLTAKDDLESIAEGFNLGAQDYIIKPFKKAELIARVSTHIELKHNRNILEKDNEWLENKIKEHTKELQIANKELQKLDEAKTDFLRMISHEIRTPLNGIMGVSDLLKTQITSSEFFNLFKLLDISVKRLEKFTLDALQITSLKTNKYKLKPSSNNLNWIINQILVSLSNAIEAKELTIENSIPADFLIEIDISLFNDALKRIIANSIKHSPPKGTIKIYVLETINTYSIRISDNGNGFSEEFLKKPITTFSTSTDFYNQNMGFDIAIVKLIIDYHNAKLKLSNLEPSGACVSIEFQKNDD